MDKGIEPRIAVSCTSNVAYIGPRHFVSKAGNHLVLSDTETSSQELIRGIGLGIQQFCCCRHHGLLAYATEDAEPRLVLWSTTGRHNCSTILNAEGAVLSLSLSNDGTQLAVSHGYPAPTVHVYTCNNLCWVAEASLEQESVDVAVNPLDKDMILCHTTDSSTILRFVMHVNKARLVEQKVDSTHGFTTCHAFYRMSFYQGTSDGIVCCFDLNGHLLGREEGSSAVLQLQQHDMPRSAITALAVTFHHLLVAQEGRQQLLLCTHFQVGRNQQVVMALRIDGHASVQRMSVGGPEHNKLLVSTDNGKQSIVYLTCSMESGIAATELLSESHTAAVTGSCPGICNSQVVTCSADGRVCIWDSSSQICTHSRVFAAEFSAITSLRQLGVLVIGSQAGVLRTVQGGPGLSVVCRSRVSDHPVSQLISTMDDGVGIVACVCGGTVLLSRVSLGGRLCDMTMLPLSGVPTALAFAHPLTGLRLLIGLTTSELVCVDVTNSMMPDGPSLQERRMRLPAPIAAMSCLRSSSQNSIGRICAVFLDHMLRCCDLASDATAWTTAKGRSLRGQDVLEIDGSTVGAQLTLTASHGRDVVVVSSSCGSIWKADIGSREHKPVCVHIGNAAGGGVRTLSFNAVGSTLLAGCKDGSIIFSAVGLPCSPEGVEDTDQITEDQASLTKDLDMADDIDEAINLLKQPMQVLPASESSTAMQTCVEQHSIMLKLATLKDHLHVLKQQNDQVPSSEQVSQNDFIIHTKLATSMRIAGKARIEKLRKKLLYKSVETRIIGQRISKQCQSGMALHQQTISGIRLPTVIHSYPQRKREISTGTLSHILFLQAVEATEWRSTGRQGMAVAITVQEASSEHATQQNSDEDSGPVTDNLLQGSSCLYSEWDQMTIRRRVTALRVIETQILHHQSAFNSKLQKFAQKRQNVEDLLHEQKQKVIEAAEELRSMGFHPSAADCKCIQVPAATCTDDQIIMETFLDEPVRSSRIHLTSTGRDTDTVQASNCTPSSQRALQQMMSGELISKATANMVWVLQKPDWMMQPSSEWSEEQKDLAQQFNSEQKRLDEQRESRRQVLEGEMRSTLASSEEICTKIDDEIIRLLSQKRLIDQLIGELELKAITACRGVDSLMRLGLNERKNMLAKGSGMQMREQTLRAVVQFVREKVAGSQHTLDQQVTADRQLERSLKTLLQDAEDVAPDLQAIARTWDTFRHADVDSQHKMDLFPCQTSKQDHLSVLSENPLTDMPRNCDPGMWQKLLRWYSSKAQSSNSIIYMQADLADLKETLESIVQECERISKTAKECIDKSHSLQQAAKKNMEDLPVSLHLKNEIIEIDTVSTREDVPADARLLNVENVNQLNKAVRERGTACVNILKEVREFKVGIYKLLYDCKRLDMEGEDASRRVRDLQLLRVTSELNQMFANPSKATKKSSIQMQQMEAQMQHNHILHQKAVNDRERHSASLALQMGKKAKINAQLQVQVMGLADLMDDQIPVMDSVLCTKDPDRRAKSLATTKKLKDIMKAQQKEIASVKEELHRLNLGSFPAFSSLYTHVPDADTDGTPDKIAAAQGHR